MLQMKHFFQYRLLNFDFWKKEPPPTRPLTQKYRKSWGSYFGQKLFTKD
jgi:hypothetical protein